MTMLQREASDLLSAFALGLVLAALFVVLP